MVSLFNSGVPIDTVTLGNTLEKDGVLEAIGGSNYFKEIMTNVPLSLNISSYCKIIKEKYLARCLIKAAEDINADGIIESGRLMKKLLANGIAKVHRDTFHADLGFGRYALALLWYKVLTGNDVKANNFKGFDVPVSKEEIEIVKECVSQI